jgi:hypothetical protein
MRKLLALLTCGLLPAGVVATPVTIDFSGHANPQMIVDGRFNSIYETNEDIFGTLLFDDSLFADLATSYFAEQEYPSAYIAFTLRRTVDGVVYDTFLETEQVVQQTYYADLRLTTNSSASTLSFSNLEGTGLFATSFAQLFFDVDVEVNTLQDFAGTVSQIRLTYNPGTTFVHRYYSDVEFASPALIPEPSSLALLLAGLGLLGFAARRRK